LGIYKGLKVVFSTEQADKSKVIEVEEGPKKSIIGTVPFLPAIFGCFLASVVINDLSNC
jgi:tRNA A37 threonylcarbamoyladenosine dehydratase